MYFARIIFVLCLISLSDAYYYKLRIGFCTYECTNNATAKKAPQGIKGYYWRDYKGVIPLDAYPLGDKNQSPQTYIGHVMDRDNRRLVTVTIIDGQSYVYVVKNNTVKKLTKEIKILCTKESKSMQFVKLSGSPSSAESLLVESGNEKFATFYAARIKNNADEMAYATQIVSLSNNVEYVTSTGVAQQEEPKYISLLYYVPTNATDDANKGNNNMTSCSKNNPKMSKDGLLPSFYRKLVLGSCSVTCTNMYSSGGESSGYYWKPNNVDLSDLLIAGKSNGNTDLYIGEGYFPVFDSIHLVGKVERKSSKNVYNLAVVEADSLIGTFRTENFRLLCTQTPDHFKWIPVNASSFLQMRDKLIIAGSLKNGSELAIIRAKRKDQLIPGAAPLVDHPILVLNDYDRSFENVEVLTYDESSTATNESQSFLLKLITFLRNAFGVGIQIQF